MLLDVQWFVSAILSENLISPDKCQQILSSLKKDTDIATVAQALLDVLSQGLSEADANQLLGAFQQLIEYAQKQAESGTPPDDSFLNAMIESKKATLAASCSIEIFNDSVVDMTGLISKPVAQGWEGMPDFSQINNMDDKSLKNFMLNLLKEVRRRGASDLHLSAMANPFVRHCGLNKCISNYIITPAAARRLNCILLSDAQLKILKEQKDLNYAISLDASKRLRVCLMVHKDGISGSYRMVPERVMSLKELGFSEENTVTIERFLDYHNGLILITGPIGSGKTTTLASLIAILNEKRQDHIITVEDPIEIVQHSKNCNVTQRELLTHTSSYKAALKGALREDPDIIIIGELHDLSTIEMAITASETGHLVIGTLHTCDAANTLNRLLDVFPPAQQAQIRTMTSGSLRGIVCQKLLPTVQGGMTVAAEILVNNTAVANLISEGKTHQLRAVMQTGQQSGMVTMDNSVLNLYKAGCISSEVADNNIRARDVKEEFKRFYAINEAKKLSKNK